MQEEPLLTTRFCIAPECERVSLVFYKNTRDMVKHSGFFTFPECFYLLLGYFYFRSKKLGRCGKPKRCQETPECFMLADLRELVIRWIWRDRSRQRPLASGGGGGALPHSLERSVGSRSGVYARSRSVRCKTGTKAEG
jgi:hypothetical protein